MPFAGRRTARRKSGFQEWTTAGSFTFTVPEGVTAVRMYGVGGSGGTGLSFDATSGSGGGGGGIRDEDVFPGQNISVVVGAGGDSGSEAPTAGSNETDGENTTVGNSLICRGGASGPGGSSAGDVVGPVPGGTVDGANVGSSQGGEGGKGGPDFEEPGGNGGNHAGAGGAGTANQNINEADEAHGADGGGFGGGGASRNNQPDGQGGDVSDFGGLLVVGGRSGGNNGGRETGGNAGGGSREGDSSGRGGYARIEWDTRVLR